MTTPELVLSAVADLTARGVGRVQLEDVRAAVNKSRSVVAEALAALVASGAIIHHGRKGAGYYTVAESHEVVRARAAKVAEDRATPACAKAAIHALLTLPAAPPPVAFVVAVDGAEVPAAPVAQGSRPFRPRRIVRARVLRVELARAESVAKAEPDVFAWAGSRAVCNAVASGILDRDARGPPVVRGALTRTQLIAGEKQCR